MEPKTINEILNSKSPVEIDESFSLPKLTFGELATIVKCLNSNPETNLKELLKDLQGGRTENAQGPPIRFSSISGMASAKQTLEEVLLGPSKYPKLYKQIRVKLPQNILLYGYSGCGKTMLAKSLEEQFGLPFFYVKGPEVLNKYIGASEENVRKLFDRAKACAPSILFFDEFDSIAQQRGNPKIITLRIGEHGSHRQNREHFAVPFGRSRRIWKSHSRGGEYSARFA